MNVADLRKGDWIDQDGKALVVQSIASSHSGRGARSFLVTTKDALTHQVVVIKPNPRDDFEKMEMTDSACQFMYQNGDEFVLTDAKTLEEHSVPSRLVDPNLARLLEGGSPVKLRLSNNRPVLVTAAQSVRCTVAKVLDSKEGTDKKKTFYVEVAGGARVACSVQTSPGDAIMVNVEDLSYSCRA